MPGVPAEVELLILSRLPTKSLCRFRCVCKTWLHILSTDPLFTKLPLHQSAKTPTILFREIGRQKKTFIISEEVTSRNDVIEIRSPVKTSQRIIGSCNGILCLINQSHKNYGIYLWNPITKELCTIPGCPHDNGSSSYGFGFCEYTNQYKIVCLVNLSDPKKSLLHSARAHVYTLGDYCGWRSLNRVYHNIIAVDSGKLWNGGLYWISHNRKSIIEFDLKKEFFLYPQLPSNGSVGSLQILDGLLCLITYQTFEPWSVQVRVMKEDKQYGTSWEKLCRIEQSPGDIEVVGTWRQGEIIVCRWFRRLLLFNLKGELIEETRDLLPPTCQAWSYVPSLVSPTAIARVGQEQDEVVDSK